MADSISKSLAILAHNGIHFPIAQGLTVGFGGTILPRISPHYPMQEQPLLSVALYGPFPAL